MSEDNVLYGRRVLVVEDETLICMMIEDMLIDFGCHIVGPAANLEEALALAAEESIDVAILDMNLNGTPSLPVADALEKRGIPFIFASGYGGESLSVHKGSPVLSKPFQERELAKALVEALPPLSE